MSSMKGRLVVAACLVLAGLAGAAVTAVAQPDDRFGTPLVQPGDRWLYNATGAVPSEPPFSPDATWRLADVAYQAGWAVRAMDAHGGLHDARQLDEVHGYRLGDGDDPSVVLLRSWHALVGAEAVTSVTELPGAGAGATNEIIGPVNVTSGDHHVRHETVVGFGVSAPLCGHAHDRQGSAQPLQEGLVVYGACHPERWDGAAVAVELRSLGARDWNGRTVEAFGAVGVEAWLDPAVAVPVRLHLGNVTFDLAGYESAAPPADRAFPIHEVPALTFAPRSVTGPDESGVQHPFPLSAAYAAAVAEPGSGLADHLAAHPKARVVQAEYHEHVDDRETPPTWTHRWTFTVSDGGAAHGVQADLVWSGVSGVPRPIVPVPLPPPPGPTPYPGPVQDAVQRIEAIPVEPAPGPWPAPEDLLEEMPTVASLLARWDAAKAEGRGAGQAWGFKADCASTCGTGGWTMWAGLARTTLPAEVGVTLAYAYTSEPEISTLEVDGSGVSRLHREVTMREMESLAVGDLIVGSTLPAKASGSPAVAVGSLPGQAVAIGAFATAAALLVLAWPWLKAGGPVALFSRLTGGRILENPRRAAIVDLVEAEPGIHLRELARRLDLGEGALRHHLSALQAAGRIRAVRGPRYLCYFPAGGLGGAGGVPVDRALASAAPLLKSDVARRLLERCVEQPGLSGQQLAAELGVTPGAITYHVQRLSAAGLLQQRRLGREQLVDVTPLGRAAV